MFHSCLLLIPLCWQLFIYTFSTIISPFFFFFFFINYSLLCIPFFFFLHSLFVFFTLLFCTIFLSFFFFFNFLQCFSFLLPCLSDLFIVWWYLYLPSTQKLKILQSALATPSFNAIRPVFFTYVFSFFLLSFFVPLEVISLLTIVRKGYVYTYMTILWYCI